MSIGIGTGELEETEDGGREGREGHHNPLPF